MRRERGEGAQRQRLILQAGGVELVVAQSEPEQHIHRTLNALELQHPQAGLTTGHAGWTEGAHELPLPYPQGLTSCHFNTPKVQSLPNSTESRTAHTADDGTNSSRTMD